MPPSHAHSPPLYRLHRFWIGLILVLGVIFYANSFRGALVFDDDMMIVGASRMANAPLAAWVRPGPRTVGAATFGLNYLAGGVNTFGYHLVNLVIHLSAATLLYWLLWRTFQSPRLAARYGPAAIPLAGVIALIWTLHPLQTQSVTYIVQRYESLMGLFFLLTLACFIRGVDSGQRSWLIASLGCCMLGMGTKEVMVAAPIMVLWYDRVFLAESWRELWRKRRGYYACYLLVIGALIGFIAAQWSWISKRGSLFHDHMSPLVYAMNQGPVILHYIRLAFWPQGQNIDYGWAASDNLYSLYAADLVMLVLLILVIWSIWKAPALGFLGGWFFVILAPSSSFAPIIDLAFEHRMYLPLLSLAVLAVVGGYELIVRFAPPLQQTKIAGAAAAVILLSLGVTTALRNEVYDSPMSLWSDVVRKSPDNWRGYTNVGKQYVLQQNQPQAYAFFFKAYQLKPLDHRVLSNYASILETYQPNPTLSELCYQRAIADNPDFVDARFNYGMFLFESNRLGEAKEQLQIAYRKAPHLPALPVTLAAIALQEEDRAAAQAYLEQELAKNPRNAKAHQLLGNCLEQRDDHRAVVHYLTAIHLNPRYVEAHNNLADVFVRLGRYDLAQTHLQAALTLEPQNKTVQRNLAAVKQALATPP
ncbi:tetratricopeptide repeat protein [Blastopirellula sp. J2-11]|uniref:tetratricopeptide repeat protein n=1 Tax=Blastopirellula sp. J2-11 TaxID=2943192 RepID=UPI0021C580D0|nr:tetratricopeptide repeat protein [Blastopirellula sp. J2-11]UUO07454.1 tetratricopeptide repeat protein [Blastopirellula sp. J2-11]